MLNNDELRLKNDLVAKLAEIKTYDALIAIAASKTVKLDLDDGVKVNYPKLSQCAADVKPGSEILEMKGSKAVNEELVNGLAKLLSAPSSAGRRIVTWYDADGENAEYLDEIKEALGSVEIVVFNDNPLFVRSYVLHEVPKDNVIIYRASEQPDPMKNQLLDIELANASDVFILMNQLLS